LLFVERSNRTERLLEGLTERLMAPGRDPLAPNRVVVQGPGMERWIAQSIAREYGVLANTDFPFPRGFLDLVFGTIPDEFHSKANAEWEVEKLTWRIAKHLEAGRDDPEFEALARHLRAPDGDWRLVQLAHRIAHLLDQYITNRPDWVVEWAQTAALPDGGAQRWQARLFRDVYAEIGGGHVADRALAFEKAIASGDSSLVEARLAAEFGGAIEIFAVSTLPPLYLSVIDRLATVCDVHLSVLSPSRHYWADLWREIKDESALAAASGSEWSEADTVFDLGSVTPAATPAAILLAGLGRLGADFQRNVESFTQAQDGHADLFEVPGAEGGSPNLLERVQRRFLELDDDDTVDDTHDNTHDNTNNLTNNLTNDNTRNSTEGLVSPDDDSIRIHVCHGTRRELEVVEACLRHAFERDTTLQPEDVLVMAPSIDEIAPDIVAVFGASSDETRSIPYRIADRGAFRSSKVALAFRELLALLGGRATRSEVLDWLSNESVAARFGLDTGGLEILAEWSERAGIRFGLDADHRERMGLAREDAHTFAGGIDRLVLAHAVGPGGEVFAGLSAESLDGFGDPDLLGAIGELQTILGDAFEMATKSQDVPSWCAWLRQLLDRLFERTDANAHEHALIRDVLQNLADSSKTAGFDRAIPFEAIRESLGFAIESSPAAQPFLSGGVTFCELVPLRAIPFRVIVILGMSDDAFPRGRPALGFDLMARNPRPGDRTTRHDDRYLFLEALLSARDQLIVTVPGRDVRDGSDLPPSVVISDLLDMLDEVFELDSNGSGLPTDGESTGQTTDQSKGLRDWLVVSHPLQTTSPRYFEATGDSRLLGRDSEAFLGARARRVAVEAGGGVRRRFLPEASAGVETGEGKVDANKTEGVVVDHSPSLSLEELIRRILRSTRTFAREELRLRLPRPEASVEDLDPIDVAGLAQYGLGSAMLDMLQGGDSPEKTARRLLAHASVPVGVAGRLSLTAMRVEVEAIAEIGAARCSGARRADVDFSLDLSDPGGASAANAGTLIGRLDRLWPGGRIQLGFTKIGRRGDLDLWIRHLVLCSLVEDGADLECRSVFVGRAESRGSQDRVVVFGPVVDARRHLARLFEWAMTAPDAPLPFFPRTSRVFATRVLDEKADQGWRDAHQEFEGGDGWNRLTPESQEELEMARVWEGWSPLASSGPVPVRVSFAVLAEEFFRPLLAAREVHAR
jgi:exodeoxyribonuclease V gamma subunit